MARGRGGRGRGGGADDLLGGIALVAVAALAAAAAARLSGAAPAGGGGDPASCTKSLQSRGLQTTASAASQARLDELARQFYEHCASVPSLASDPRVRNLAMRWNRHVLLSDFPGDARNVLGSFNAWSGCLYMRDMPTKSLPEQLGILLHELAHSNGTAHDSTWRNAFLFFCDIATRQLGWVVALGCPTVCKSYGVCAPSSCPLCDWTPNNAACQK